MLYIPSISCCLYNWYIQAFFFFFVVLNPYLWFLSLTTSSGFRIQCYTLETNNNSLSTDFVILFCKKFARRFRDLKKGFFYQLCKLHVIPRLSGYSARFRVFKPCIQPSWGEERLSINYRKVCKIWDCTCFVQLVACVTGCELCMIKKALCFFLQMLDFTPTPLALGMSPSIIVCQTSLALSQ
jgi:hypothetical protein